MLVPVFSLQIKSLAEDLICPFTMTCVLCIAFFFMSFCLVQRLTFAYIVRKGESVKKPTTVNPLKDQTEEQIHFQFFLLLHLLYFYCIWVTPRSLHYIQCVLIMIFLTAGAKTTYTCLLLNEHALEYREARDEIYTM